MSILTKNEEIKKLKQELKFCNSVNCSCEDPLYYAPTQFATDLWCVNINCTTATLPSICNTLAGDDIYELVNSLRTSPIYSLWGTWSVVPEGPELVTNGTFTGNADGWLTDGNTPLDSNYWSYSNNNVIHEGGDSLSLYQTGTLIENTETYLVKFSVSGRTLGNVDVQLDAGSNNGSVSINGDFQFIGTWTNDSTVKIKIVPSIDFDGVIDNVSVKVAPKVKFTPARWVRSLCDGGTLSFDIYLD